MNEISPYDTFERALRRWWMIALCMLAGGLIGWGLAFLLHPVYEARANYLVSFDAEQLARLKGLQSADDLDFREINSYFSAAEEVFYHMDTRKALVKEAQAHGIELSISEFGQSKFYVDRQSSRWIIEVRHTDPAEAAWLANTWLAITDTRLREAQAHGINAEALRLATDAVQACFAKLDFAAANQCAGTHFSTPDEFQAWLQSSMSELQNEGNLSLGVSPLLSFMIQRDAMSPGQPILYVRSQMALAGALLGLILGTLLVQLLPERHR
jgi:hypothetical protein